ncbi:hypothetical protein SEEM054_02192, partial [Salmonella enterica subsp. enterica serovar Montevideo str. NC_MB110209-0054]
FTSPLRVISTSPSGEKPLILVSRDPYLTPVQRMQHPAAMIFIIHVDKNR